MRKAFTALCLINASGDLQGWWGGPGAAASEAAASSGEEDGAVEALVEGPAPAAGQAEEPGTWLRRLGQLQNLAASAAATSVGGVTSLLPTYAHFGRTLMWPLVRCHP